MNSIWKGNKTKLEQAALQVQSQVQHDGLFAEQKVKVTSDDARDALLKGFETTIGLVIANIERRNGVTPKLEELKQTVGAPKDKVKEVIRRESQVSSKGAKAPESKDESNTFNLGAGQSLSGKAKVFRPS